MLNPMTFFEAFGNYPHEQQELFDFLVKEKIGGVIFLSGDRHAGELIRYRHEGSKSYWYDFTSSPLGSGSGRYMPEAENPARVPGTWVTRTRNYGRVRLLGKGDERRVVMSAHDKGGRQLWEHSVRAAELWR
jgi:alkaline phosphatase D